MIKLGRINIHLNIYFIYKEIETAKTQHVVLIEKISAIAKTEIFNSDNTFSPFYIRIN